MFIFLDLIELKRQSAETITDTLLKCLKTVGFTEDYLKTNWASFVSDGASVMLGKKSGVATRLWAIYLFILSWHCMNHRLELAVNDAVNSVTATNCFKAFVEEIHNVYSYKKPVTVN